MADQPQYDVLIVGAGIAGSIIASELAAAGKRVLILEAGQGVPDNRSEYMDNFYLSNAKTPESPYPPLGLQPAHEATPRPTILGLNVWTDPNQSYLIQPQPETPQPQNLPFASTYERVGGGTTWHWLGTSLRLVPHDLEMYSYYNVFDKAADWPIGYDELSQLYGRAEAEIGVSASVAQQAPLENAIGLTYPPGYQYPLNPIPLSVVDQTVSQGVSGLDSPVSDDKPVFVTPTPAGRNSQPYQNRRVCAGNTNCIPICPIQAKYDATVTLGKALNTGNVTVTYKAVVSKVLTDANGSISGVQYIPWDRQVNPTPGEVQTATAATYVLAAHAIEIPKILLLSANEQFPKGIANRSDQVGRNLMDHVIYLSWALSAAGQPVYPYRGPLSTSGIESLRDGDFRRQRAAFRMEIGNEGWNFPIGDPYVTVQDFINGTNNSRLNPISPPSQVPFPPPAGPPLGGVELALAINDRLTRQFRIACLLEQSPQAGNRVTLDPTRTDGLGLARPKISYGLDPYTLDGFAAARETSSAIYRQMNATEFTDYQQAQNQAGYFEYEGVPYVLFGAGHVVGTHRMGSDPDGSVTNAAQRSWDHDNLWIVGCGSFPTVSTPNPTLTLAALAFKAAADIRSALGG
ncbi:MAG TPA: GMC family oxidoreductase [Thermoanaerobaculia bacterium]|jgi:choline dehydrogenase-like flavoprotein|nr:GMC family oxidoreductase [Thermoanaerobaculia bacterium]